MAAMVGNIPEFELLRPKDLQQALAFLAELGASARVIAGGTDVLPGFRNRDQRLQKLKYLVDIHHLPELQGIEKENGRIYIGAAVTFADLIRHPLISQYVPLLAQAGGRIGSAQIRNRATLAGNFVNNAACADSVPPLLVYDAVVHIRSQHRMREKPLGQFLLRPQQIQLDADEIVTGVSAPILNENYRGDFYKLGRRRGVAISRLTLAVLIRVQQNVIQDLRIASGAVTPIGQRFTVLEQVMRGQKADAAAFEQCAWDLGRQVLQVTGLRWSSAYKLPVLQQACYTVLMKIANSGEL